MQTNDKLDAAPLLALVESRGGVSSLPGMGVAEMVETPDTRLGKNYGEIRVLTVDRTEEEARAFDRVEQVITRAQRRGWILYNEADAFCCEVLKLHPAEVFGEEWWSTQALAEEDYDAWIGGATPVRWAREVTKREQQRLYDQKRSAKRKVAS